MTKKDVECQIHTWMIKKAKAMVYKGRKDRRKGDGKKTRGKEKENHISRACPKRLIAMFHVRILNLFTLKSNILAQDQTRFLSCTL